MVGVLVKLWMFCMRLSASGQGLPQGLRHPGPRSFLGRPRDAFTRLGGVPAGRIRYDNLKPAVARVLLGRDRVEIERFIMFRSHFGFDSLLLPARASRAATKKAGSRAISAGSGATTWSVPRVASLAELNEMIAAADDADRAG